MNERHEYISHRELCLELLASIRTYEARINELIGILDCHNGFIANERRFSVLIRLERLITSREQLIESFNTVSKESRDRAAGRDTCNPFDRITMQYADLRSQARELLKEYEEGTKMKPTTTRERVAYAVAIMLFGALVITALVGIDYSASLDACESDTIASIPNHCDYPPPKQCKRYVKEMETWIKSSMASDKQWQTCTVDLARCQNEINRDIMCITPDCQ